MVFDKYLEAEFRDLRLVLSRWVTIMVMGDFSVCCSKMLVCVVIYPNEKRCPNLCVFLDAIYITPFYSYSVTVHECPYLCVFRCVIYVAPLYSHSNTGS